MLVLSRKLGERIFIGDGPDRIEVYVAEIQRGRIRLGITAPGDMQISRSGGPGPKTKTGPYQPVYDEGRKRYLVPGERLLTDTRRIQPSDVRCPACGVLQVDQPPTMEVMYGAGRCCQQCGHVW